MKTIKVKNQKITVHQYHTLIVGAGAAGMNCAIHLELAPTSGPPNFASGTRCAIASAHAVHSAKYSLKPQSGGRVRLLAAE